MGTQAAAQAFAAVVILGVGFAAGYVWRWASGPVRDKKADLRELAEALTEDVAVYARLHWETRLTGEQRYELQRDLERCLFEKLRGEEEHGRQE